MNELAELRRKRAAHYAAMQSYVAKDTDETPFGETENENYKAMCVKLDEHDSRISRLEDLNDRAAETAEPVTDSDDEDGDSVEMTAKTAVTKKNNIQPLIQMSRKHEAPGTQFARFMIGAGLASKSGSLAVGTNYIRDQLGDRQVAKALASNIQASGGALVPQDYRAELISLLTADAVVRSIVDVTPMPMGNLTYPRMNSGMAGNWIGESQQIAVTQQTFDNIQLVAHQLSGAVPVNNNLIRRSPLTVEQIVRSDIVKQLRLKEDITLLTATTATGYAPNGLVGLALNVSNTVVALSTLSTVNNFLLTAELTLQAQNVDTTGATWIFHPSVRTYLATLTDSVGRYFFKEELDRGMLNGYKYKTTTQLPTNLGNGSSTQIFFVQGSELIFADTLEMIADSSSDATYWDGAAWQSAYMTDRTIFRAIEQIDFNVKHPAAIFVATVSGATPSFWTGMNAGSPWTTQPSSNGVSYAESADPTSTAPSGT